MLDPKSLEETCAVPMLCDARKSMMLERVVVLTEPWVIESERRLPLRR